MLWGAVAGTIPDLDVIAGTVADPITNLAFHRCVTHSLYYAVLASPVLAWMVRALYDVDGRGRLSLRYPLTTWLPGALAIYALIVVGSLASPTPLRGVWSYAAVVAVATVLAPLLVWGWRSVRPRSNTRVADGMSYARWLGLFVLCIATHPLLDCFTTYGTQVLQPFDDLRVAWNTISVADPAYTLPFLVCLLVASRALRQNSLRRRLTWLGIALSTAYLGWTVYNLYQVRAQVSADLAERDISYERFLVTPTLLQNVLWSVVVDQGDSLLTTNLSLLDEPFALAPRSEVLVFPKGEHYLTSIRDERAVEVATWFSDGYYTAFPGQGDTLNLYDLRFGVVPGASPRPVFGFHLYPRGVGEEWGLEQAPIREEDLQLGELFGGIWDRMMGKTSTAR